MHTSYKKSISNQLKYCCHTWYLENTSILCENYSEVILINIATYDFKLCQLC